MWPSYRPRATLLAGASGVGDGFGCFAGRAVAFGGFLADEFVVDPVGFLEGNDVPGFASGGQGVAATAIGEGHDVALAFGFDGDVVFLV